ncbi:MAG: Uma2 family endonuclease [Tepidisphaeraceae bacterium]
MTTTARPIPPPPPPADKALPFDTLDELIDALGVPASRILLNPPIGTATEADVVRLVDGEPKRLVELIDGTLVEKAMGNRESELAAVLVVAIGSFVYPRKLGKVYGADLMARMKGKNVRLPDVAFVAYADVPGGKLVHESIMSASMTLAVEALSPGNTRKEMRQKREEYFASGARRVWEFDMNTRTCAVYSTPEQARILREGDTLDGEDVLPGFTVGLAELFAQVDRQGP